MPPFNPFGLHTVTPYLLVKDVLPLIDFIKEIFGATQRGEIRYREDDSVQHAEVIIGDSVVMLGEPNDDIEATSSMLYVYVDDCDSAFKKALDRGASTVLEPDNYPHGDRYGGVRDRWGNIWWIVKHVGKDQG